MCLRIENRFLLHISYCECRKGSQVNHDSDAQPLRRGFVANEICIRWKDVEEEA